MEPVRGLLVKLAPLLAKGLGRTGGSVFFPVPALLAVLLRLFLEFRAAILVRELGLRVRDRAVAERRAGALRAAVRLALGRCFAVRAALGRREVLLVLLLGADEAGAT